jgi:hypothetical protein
MYPTIDFLIHKFDKYNVDMLRNISSSSCADQAKFAMAYKDFNINSDYSEQIETNFKITEEYFKKKWKDPIIKILMQKEILIKLLL